MSIRARIALLSAALSMVVLMAIGTGVYFTLQRSLHQEIDARLARVANGIAGDSKVGTTLSGQPVVAMPNFNPFAFPGLYIRVTYPDGTLYNQAPNIAGLSLLLPPDVLARNQQGTPVYYTTDVSGTPVRVLSAPLLLTGSNTTLVGTVQVAEPVSPLLRTLAKLRLLFLSGLGIGILLTAIGAFVLSGRSLRPLTRITTIARQIGRSGDLSRRIELPRTGDEVQDLAQTFNEMLSRLDDAFTAERRFVSDASHELRTPLTALRGNAEILLRQVEAGHLNSEDAIEILTDIRDESERMGRLVQNLLTLARADVGWRPELEPVELDQIAADAARVAAPLVGNHRFAVQIAEEVDVVGNADQLKQLLLILLDNAFTYTPDDGQVALNVRRCDDRAEIVVSDTGPGIAPEQLERIFDRFYRGEAARNKRAVGAGLGLPIARWIVECHHGAVAARSILGQGTTIVVDLPGASGPESPPVEPEVGRPERVTAAA